MDDNGKEPGRDLDVQIVRLETVDQARRPTAPQAVWIDEPPPELWTSNVEVGNQIGKSSSMDQRQAPKTALGNWLQYLPPVDPTSGSDD